MKKVRIRRVLIFLLLTFALSWGFDWLIKTFSGNDPYISLGMNPRGMLVPAFIAIILQMYFFKDSPIYFRVYKEKPRWILHGFLFLTVIYGILIVIAVVHPEMKRIFQGAGALLFTLWTLLIFFVYGQSEKKSFSRAGLQLGNLKIGQRFIAGIILFFLLQSALNFIFGLGDWAGQSEYIYGLPIPASLYIPSMIVLFFAVTVIGIPLSGLAGVFGEEFGWRGFLFSELMNAGKVKAVLLVGLIWGVWHFPIILRGIHTYPPTVTGLFLDIIFFILWGIIQGYAVIRTGSIWVASFMHGVVNSVYSFSITYLVKPESKIYSFGLGIYGLLCLAIIVIVILRDSIWRNQNRINKN